MVSSRRAGSGAVAADALMCPTRRPRLASAATKLWKRTAFASGSPAKRASSASTGTGTQIPVSLARLISVTTRSRRAASLRKAARFLCRRELLQELAARQRQDVPVRPAPKRPHQQGVMG